MKSPRRVNECNRGLPSNGRSGGGSLTPVAGGRRNVALSCPMALDVLCQEVHEAW